MRWVVYVGHAISLLAPEAEASLRQTALWLGGAGSGDRSVFYIDRLLDQSLGRTWIAKAIGALVGALVGLTYGYLSAWPQDPGDWVAVCAAGSMIGLAFGLADIESRMCGCDRHGRQGLLSGEEQLRTQTYSGQTYARRPALPDGS